MTETDPVPHRVLVVGPSWIGDMVMAQSLFMLLRERMPNAVIDVLAPSITASLLARMPEVDNAVRMEIGHREIALGKRRQTARALAERGYDQAIVLQRSIKAALVPWLAGIPQRTGYLGEMRYGLINDVRSLDKDRYPRKVEHYALLGLAREGEALAELKHPELRIDTARRAELVDALGLETNRAAIGFAPGAAYGGAKQWPATHFARLAAELDQRGIACWIFGSAADRQLAADLTAAAPKHGVNLCERTSLVDIADIASLTDAFVGNDTGVMHLAAAAAPRVLAIYGSTHPDYAPPLSNAEARFWLELACAPCRKRQCPLGHNACMRDIPVADVLRACLDPAARDIPSLHYASGGAPAPRTSLPETNALS
ncbi:ADP-heptose--LPS heptosyltransferase II [Salinisphaera sp. C84B14]|uniref:lipopolysaccharide heptosyltransferase II n=1 Tax=Salinisphaera sp. C84B14 TaxID=1304155 RepID=UPI003341C5A3